MARGLGARLWERTIAPTLQEYILRPAFERACRQYLWRALAADRTPIDLDFSEVGSWWGKRDEIDVVALNDRRQVLLIGSCKWTGTPIDVDAYAALQRSATLAQPELTPVNDPWFALFSRQGFTFIILSSGRPRNRNPSAPILVRAARAEVPAILPRLRGMVFYSRFVYGPDGRRVPLAAPAITD